MCYTYGRSKTIIKQRRKKYQQQLEQIENEIAECLKVKPGLFRTPQIMTVLTGFVHNDKHQLQVELKRRRAMLKFDAEDQQLIQAFYELKPR